jgi:hypothetical protein
LVPGGDRRPNGLLQNRGYVNVQTPGAMSLSLAGFFSSEFPCCYIC